MELVKALFTLVDETVDWAAKAICSIIDMVSDKKASGLKNGDNDVVIIKISRVKYRPWYPPEGRKE